jgi:hypothetical protein
MVLTDAEQQMIELLRQTRHATLTISQDGDQWHMRLEDHEAGHIATGAGPTFDRAWHGIGRPK